MLLPSWLGGWHPLGGRQTNSRNPRTLHQRPLIEPLEDRLPPGDAVLAGLLAGDLIPARVAGLNPAAPPGEARRLAEPGPGVADFTLLAGVTDDAVSVADPAEKLARLDRGERPAEEPFAHPVAPAHGGVSLDGRGVQDFGGSSSSAFPPLAASGSAVVFASPAPANFQLGQAVAALGVPAHAREESPDSILGTGAGAQSGGVQALFDLGQPTTGPFPADMFTVPNPTHNTGRRVHLPFPDCQVYVSDCEDIAVLNELDGFNLQPRLSVPFSGPIDVDSVTSDTVFLVSLGSTLPHGGDPRGTVIGINQTVWDVATHTLHVESDALLAQHTRYALIVTNGVRDAGGDRVEASPEFRRFRQTVPQPYKGELLDAVREARRLGVRERDLVTASVFTTQSATAILEKIRDQIHATTPAPADFLLGPGGARTVFNLDNVSGLTWNQQTRVDGPLTPVRVPIEFLNLIPGTVGTIAFGKYLSPDYQVHPGEYMPPVGTRTGTPVVQGVNELFFNLYLPSGPMPAGGWPVAIFGHGTGSSKQGGGPGGSASLAVAASLAEQGIATVAINAVGHGLGPLSTLTVNPSVGAPVTFPEGGRGIDQDGDGIIGSSEGIATPAPRSIIWERDGRQQTVADLLQLVRVVGAGMDVDGDGSGDLNPSRVYYAGQSLGGIYGAPFLAVEPGVRAGVLNVAGGPNIEHRRLSPANRAAVGMRLASRTPSLINPPGLPSIGGVPVGPPHFNENLPRRDQPPVINTVPGTSAIQEVFENTEWVSQPDNPVAYAPHFRKVPLPGVPAKSVILQIAKGDQLVANPTSTALLRAGDLADRATFYRHDLAFAENPQLPTNPHGFLTRFDIPGFGAILRGAQEQIATFFATDGRVITHPEPARFFEVPIRLPLPEDLNYIP